MQMSLAARSALAEVLLARSDLAGAVTAAFFSRHPDWEVRFGDAGRRRCTEDVGFHLSFLAGAVQAGQAELFTDYARWCGDMLAARSIDRAHLREHFALLEEHLDLAGDQQAFVGAMLRDAEAALAEAGASPPSLPDDRTPVRLAYLSAALAGKRGEAWEVTRQGWPRRLEIGELYRDVLIWTQRRLGELWAAAKISVAQEHMASAVTQSVVARLYAEIPGQRTAGRALIAGVEGELHVLPAQLASDLLELEGWDVAFIGTHVPAASVFAAVEAEKPDVLGLSVTMPSSLRPTVSLALAAREKFETLPIVLGGRALRGAYGLGAELGVDVDGAGDLSPFGAYRKGSAQSG